MKNLIKWTELSILLTSSKWNIRQDKIPEKYREKIERLIKAIEDWAGDNMAEQKFHP